jgi:AcrR family transcriptional regulator
MGRKKTISDDDVLRVAQTLFREQGHTATTRDIAFAAGISEAVLYQRFGSKDELFFAAMHPRRPDLDQLFGPVPPTTDAHAYLHTALVRLGQHFAEIIPLHLHVMMHPSFDPAHLTRAQPGGPAVLPEALAERLRALAKRGDVTLPDVGLTARLLVGLAHDWALRSMLGGVTPDVQDLKGMVDIVWEGLRSRKK